LILSPSTFRTCYPDYPSSYSRLDTTSGHAAEEGDGARNAIVVATGGGGEEVIEGGG
jgi:hypothetical protein